MAEDIFVKMFHMQQALQRQIPGGVTMPGHAHIWSRQDMDDIRTQVLALTDELHEAMRETSWKPWASGPSFVNPGYVDELVDAFHFFMNLMIVVGMTPHDLLARYLDKHMVNVQRHTDGTYDGNVKPVHIPVNQGILSA